MSVPYIAWLTFHEARRRRLLLVALVLGAAFLVLYAVGFYFLYQDTAARASRNPLIVREISSSMTMLGLYAVNFLVIMVSVLTSVDTISGEIATHSIQSIVTKPLRRWEVILGKWLGFAIMIAALVLVLGGGVVLIGWATSGFLPDNLPSGLVLLVLEGLILLSITLLGGTLFSTLSNGVVTFMLFILAFIGSWTEQIGAVMGNQTAVYIGIVSSLIMPTEAIWKRAAYLMQPVSLIGIFDSPFVTSSIPSPEMVLYGVLYGLAALAGAVWVFERRDL